MVRCSVGNSTRDSQGNKYHINSPPLSSYPEAVFWALATFTHRIIPRSSTNRNSCFRQGYGYYRQSGIPEPKPPTLLT